MAGQNEVKPPQNLNSTFQGPEVQGQAAEAGKEKVPGPEYADETAQNGVRTVTDKELEFQSSAAREIIENNRPDALVNAFKKLLTEGRSHETLEVIKKTLGEMMGEAKEYSLVAQQTLAQIEALEANHQNDVQKIIDDVLKNLQENNPTRIVEVFQVLEQSGQMALASELVNMLDASARQTTNLGKLALSTIDQLARVSQDHHLRQDIALAAAESPWAEDKLSKDKLYAQANRALEEEFAEDEARLAANPDFNNMTFEQQAKFRADQKTKADDAARIAAAQKEDEAAQARQKAFNSDPTSEALRRAQAEKSPS